MIYTGTGANICNFAYVELISKREQGGHSKKKTVAAASHAFLLFYTIESRNISSTRQGDIDALYDRLSTITELQESNQSERRLGGALLPISCLFKQTKITVEEKMASSFLVIVQDFQNVYDEGLLSMWSILSTQTCFSSACYFQKLYL